VRTCEEKKQPAREVTLNNKNGFLGVTVRFTITYKTKENGITYNRTISSGDIKPIQKELKQSQQELSGLD